jgi:pyrroline-5-carboxylate reductase
MAVATALAGSGPAFLFRFIDALAAAGTAMGLPEEQASRMALTMVRGASELAQHADVSPGELADRVASPGGVTRAGLDVIDAEGQLHSLLRDTLRAARDRDHAMAKEFGGFD